MKRSIVRRILVGFIAFTTVFSNVSTVASYAEDGDAEVLFETLETEEALEEMPEESSEEASVFVPESEDEVVEASEGAGADETVGEASEEETYEVVEELPEEAAGDVVDEVIEEVSSEGSSDIFDLFDEEELPEEEEVLEEDLIAVKLAQTPGQSEIPDLSDNSFAQVTNVLPGSVTDVTEEFTIGFDFFIYNAQRIPNGEFTYELPGNLDFSGAVGFEIDVYEGGVKIGTAEVDSNNIMHFHIDPTVVSQKPNGFSGSVRLSCKLDADDAGDATEVVVSFTNGESITVKVNKAVITATKAPVTISNGTAWFSVKFDVSADVQNFVITDELGSNLQFTGKYTFSDATRTLKVDFVQESEQKLVVNVGSAKKGLYTLRYEVSAIGDLDTTGMSVEEKLASANSNKASWSWEGSNVHEVYSYADQTASNWISKFGANRANPGEITPDGIAKWQLYLNGGSIAHNLAGYTLTDDLDPNMEYIKDSFEVKYSTDRKTWKELPALLKLIRFEEGEGVNRFVIEFTEDIPVGYYKIFYSSKIKGDLPTKRTKYYNTATLTKEGVVDTKTATNEYNYSGSYTSKIQKGIVEGRTSEGLVGWKSVFTVSGEKSSYAVTIKDSIAPADDCQVVGGKVVGVDILKDSDIRLVKIDGDVETPVTDFTVTIEEDNSFTLTAKKLSSGTYAIYYKTQDYIGEKTSHVFPSGSRVTITNTVSLKIDKTEIWADPVSYEISTDGLPMMKKAMTGSFDSESGDFLIPWEVTVNKNELGQSIELVSGSQMTVTDKLPEGLEYVAGSAALTDADGKGTSLEPTVSRENGKETLVWKATWNSQYYVISFKTRVADSYLKNLIGQGGSGEFTFSFENEAQGQVGNANGMANAGSKDTINLLKKVGALNEETSLLEYSVVVNEAGLDLFPDRDEVKLTDNLSSGRYVVGSLKVYELDKYDENAQDNSAALYVLADDKVKASSDGKSFEVTLPDNKAFLVKYSVIPDASQGEEAGSGKVVVTVENVATLVGNGVISSSHKDEYTIKNVHADITSNKGMIKITKVSTGNSLVGLTGAVFRLVRVDVSTGAETEIATATSDSEGVVKFERDGEYDSLIFDMLYYYQEVTAPKGYKLDDTKHYIVFKGQKYDSRIDEIKAFLGETPFLEYDTNTSETGATFDTVVENESIPDDEEDPEDPGDPGRNDIVTVTTTTTVVGDDVVTVLDLPEVLSARRNTDLPAVLGARRADTSDRNMAGTYAGLLAAFMALGFVLTKRNKDIKL